MQYRHRAAEIRGTFRAPRLRAPVGTRSIALDCREFSAFLDDFLEGRLPDEHQKIFERHMAACVPCEQYLIAYAKTSRIVKDGLCGPSLAEGDEVPPELARAIIAAFLEWRSGGGHHSDATADTAQKKSVTSPALHASKPT